MSTPKSIQLTALVKAAEQNSLTRVKELLLSGHNPNERNKYENSALAEAIFHGNIPMIKCLLRYGANSNAPESEGFSAMYELVCSPSPRSYCILKRLLKAGAKANTIVMKKPLLFHAIRHKNSKAVRILLPYGADPNLTEEGKVTPLMIAAYYGQIKILKDLLKYNANLFARNDRGEQVDAYVFSGLGKSDKVKTVLRFLSQYGFEQKG